MMFTGDRDLVHIAEQLRRYMDEAEFTQAELVKALGESAPSQSQISKWRNGYRQIPADVLAKVARILGKSIEDFYRDDLKKNKQPLAEEILEAFDRGELPRHLVELAKQLQQTKARRKGR
jgi:transcriptional regulator with XRE-family HTH domain